MTGKAMLPTAIPTGRGDDFTMARPDSLRRATSTILVLACGLSDTFQSQRPLFPEFCVYPSSRAARGWVHGLHINKTLLGKSLFDVPILGACALPRGECSCCLRDRRGRVSGGAE